MQTHFSLAQLQDPDIAVCDAILRTCVHCGFCLATCPTYQLLGNELDSPRGRIYLIKDMLEQDRPADADTVKHIDRCLSCLSCMTTCPSGVDYMHLVDHARVHIEQTYHRPWHERLMRSILAGILPYPNRMRVALRFAGLGRLSAPLLRRVKMLQPLVAMAELAPKKALAKMPEDEMPQPAITGHNQSASPSKGRVALLRGCVQSVTDPGINAAAKRLLTRAGFIVAEHRAEEACCGSLLHHMGRDAQALAQARQMIDLWCAEIKTHGLDAIVITTSGCGSTIKDYAHLLRNDPDYAQKAAQISGLTHDICEFLAQYADDLPYRANADIGDTIIAYHAACSLQHGQRILTEPVALLKKAGFTVRQPQEAHMCCGSAGTYNILQSEIAAQLLARKVEALVATGAHAVAAGNIGCITQIANGGRLPVVHSVELLDWACGGEKPAALA